MRIRAFTFGIILVVLILMAACGGHSSRQASRILPASTPLKIQADGSYEQALNSLPPDIRADVEALLPPKGCNAALFTALKKSFVEALALSLANGGKITCTPPTGDGNKATGLVVNPSGPDYILSWNYHNTGDYDQNGTVGITDITPIAMHFGHTVGTDPVDIVIDGDGGGTVGITDITPLAMSFGVNLDHYRVESSPDGTTGWAALGDVALSSGTGQDAGWTMLQYTLPDASARWLRVIPVDSGGNDGVTSDSLEFNLGTPPEIISVSPLSGATNASVQFSAVVNGVGPFTYSWSISGATPSTSTDEQPTVTLSSSAGDFACSVTVTNAAGSDLFDFTVTVGEPPVVTDVSPLTGITGTDTQFTAAVAGTAPFTYAWDFGGGAMPNMSTDESPTVNLGAVGVYDTASVTVANPYGEGFFGFTLTVIDMTMPPYITDVTPLTGEEGTPVIMNASVSGTPPLTYSWDFGSAATPSTSSEVSPEITLGPAGFYPCSLVVQNSLGSDTFNFDLTITTSTLPPNIVSVNPTTGEEDATITISAVVNGTPPFTYAWNFGAAALPSTSTDEAPLITLQESGTYPCTLDVQNAYGIDTYNFDMIITPSTAYDEVEPNNSIPEANILPAFPVSDWHCRLTQTDDENDFFSFDATAPCLLQVVMELASDDPNLDIELQDSGGTVMTGSYGTGATESFNTIIWTTGTYYLRCFYVGFTTLNAGDYWLSVTVIPLVFDEVENNDTTAEANSITFPLADFDGHCGGPVGYDGDSDDYFTFTAVEGDLLSVTMNGIDSSYDLDLYLYDTDGDLLALSDFGGPNESISYQFKALDTSPFFLRVYAYSDSGLYGLEGTCGPVAFWDTNVIDNSTSANLGGWNSLIVTNGYPGCIYQDAVNDDVYFAYSDDTTGMGTWTKYPVYVGTNSAGNWMNGHEVNGYPAAVWLDETESSIVFSMCSTVDGSGTWNTSTVDTDGVYDPSIAQIGGYPAVAYEGPGYNLRYAINSATDGTGTWTFYDVDFGDGAYYTSMIELPSGNPGIFYNSYVNTGNEVSFATCDTPDGSGTWSTSTVYSTNSYPSTSGAVVQGRPAVMVFDDSYYPYYVINSAADGSGTWEGKSVSSVNTNWCYMSLEVIDGKPTTIYSDSNSTVLYMSRSVNDDGLGAWITVPIVADADTGSCRVLGWVNSKPACTFYYEISPYWVGFATPSTWP